MTWSDFENRIVKNERKLASWAKRESHSAYRVYDWDIPEHPLVVDRFEDRLHVAVFPKRRHTDLEALNQSLRSSLASALKVSPESIFTKVHTSHNPGTQYDRFSQTMTTLQVKESGLHFEVNLSDFLDVGLFLDHRPLRNRIFNEAKGKRVLNLYAYTGSFTVYAVAGGASSTVSVDLSEKYLDWARRNLALNQLSGKHRFAVADAALWLESHSEVYDLIILDPPSFSSSKRMRGQLDIQRDHTKLIGLCLERLSKDGTLYFSTNFQKFKLDKSVNGTELTSTLTAPDLRRTTVRTWKVGHQI